MPRRAVAALGAALSVAVAASGCVADPPPPTVVGDERADGEAVSLSAGGVLLALSRVDEGFNPHLLANQGVDTDLVASLLLPSAFVPGEDGEPELNRALLVSAEPLPADPLTIRYTIAQKAQWSDGVPVAAEDFEYLWRQMRTQPGVVDPAGYERIVQVRSGAGGKVVDVVFDSPPEDWRTLFTNLLPAHILKGAPDGFQGAMATLPVMSAGPFMIRAADLGRGEIEFVPNDRYWDRAPEIDQIVVRRASGAGQLGASLRGGPGSMALVPATPVAMDVAATIPGVESGAVRGGAQLELGFNTAAPAAGDVAVRRALTAAVTPATVGRIVTGESSPAVTSFPFPRGAAAGTGDAAAVERELIAAGYTRAGVRWERDGVPLSVTLGVEAEDDVARTAAYTVADQLRGSGIGARVWELDPVALYADALPHGLVDAVLGWQRVDGPAAVAAVSRFACPASVAAEADAGAAVPLRPPVTVTSLVPPAPDTGVTPTAEPTSTTATTTTTTPARATAAALPARTSGVSGVCDPELDRALGLADGPGTGPVEPDLAAAGELVARLALRVPLVRPGLMLSVDGVDTGTSGAALDTSDFFDTAPTWRRTG